MPMENFHSEALNRDFPLIYFASSITKEGQTPPPMAPFPGHPPMGGQAARPDAQGVTEPISPRLAAHASPMCGPTGRRSRARP